MEAVSSKPAASGVTYVYDFEEPCEGGRQLLGGKGAGSPR